MDSVKLTEYSHGAGCGCKISPALLDQILQSSQELPLFPGLLVGNSSKDDAAAFDLGNGSSVLSTTDFFMPIVDDAFTFGRIAATNAISDIYAMGGRPLMAIAIFGWPVNKVPVAVGQQVVEGGRFACAAAGIPLAGGHSIDSPEPIFGLAVTGLVENAHLKRNDTAVADCELFLTKPLGIGILSTAQKQKKLADPAHLQVAIDAMCTLNRAGEAFSRLPGVRAMTDVTGFGLLGHLVEICEGSGISAEVRFDDVPVLPQVHHYLGLGCMPGGTTKNFNSYGHHVSSLSDVQRGILCDPQTSGGLLVAVERSCVEAFQSVARQEGLQLQSIGCTVPRRSLLVEVTGS
ncbi:selenide, water dikinase SelD [Desulfurispirillum indicum]|uniref:selenide, water dikinase SelD n=1 Tax=Desulfurispirillum indicum TaxID=936456 RepID=UPI001CFB0705|nr:selenide, water dikinase SelD [Desulfurispirillum indicum]UCZ57659.1 selenide, water dikinase SelD [Desulfurispirillum indicum]